MEYKKKLKLFIIGIQMVTMIAVCGVTYWSMDHYAKPLEYKMFAENVVTRPVSYKTEGVLEETETSEKGSYEYSFVSAAIDGNSVDLRGFAPVRSSKKLPSLKQELVIEGVQVQLPYNIAWDHQDETLKSLLLYSDTFSENSTIVLSTKISVNSIRKTSEHLLNPQSEEEVKKSIYPIYQEQASQFAKTMQNQQILYTVISGVISLLVFGIFYMIYFRKLFR